MENKLTAHIRRSTTLTISAAISVDTIINAVKLRNAGKAVGKVLILNKLDRALTKTTRLYQKLTTHLASRVPLLTRYIELISIHISVSTGRDVPQDGTNRDGTSRCPFVPGQRNFLVSVSLCPGTRAGEKYVTIS